MFRNIPASKRRKKENETEEENKHTGSRHLVSISVGGSILRP